jgi:hypothetical protein
MSTVYHFPGLEISSALSVKRFQKCNAISNFSDPPHTRIHGNLSRGTSRPQKGPQGSLNAETHKDTIPKQVIATHKRVGSDYRPPW